MKKTTAILCAALSLFAACTKTALPEPPSPELPVEETTAQEDLKRKHSVNPVFAA